jgi:hypothetical protein
MLFGLFQGSVIRDSIVCSINGSDDDRSNWDADRKDSEIARIQAVFAKMSWSSLYEGKAWWDVLGLDRAIRVWRVKSAIQEVVAAQKVQSLSALKRELNGPQSFPEIREGFPIFKTQELKLVKKAEDPSMLLTIDSLSQKEIDRLSTLIEKGGLPATKISEKDRQLLLKIAGLYRDLRKVLRSDLPSKLSQLFKACSVSKMMLFRIEQSIHEHREFFRDNHHSKTGKSLFARKRETVAGPGASQKKVLKSLHDLGPHLFNNRTFRFVKQGSPDVSVNDLESLCGQLSCLSGSDDSDFDRTVELALLEAAYAPFMDHRSGGLQWKIEQLTGKSLSQGFGDDLTNPSPSLKIETLIIDKGDGNIEIVHKARADLQEGMSFPAAGTKVGIFGMDITYTISKKGGVEKVETSDARIDWDPKRIHPFYKLKGTSEADLSQLYRDAEASARQWEDVN